MSDLVKRAIGRLEAEGFIAEAEAIEALEGELFELGKTCGETFDALRKADARAERLRVALEDVVDAYDFVIVDEYDRGWSSVSDAVVAARKAIRAAAGGGE